MNESVLPAEHSVSRKLRQAWKKERRFVHFRGFCHFLIWLVAMVLLAVLVDWPFTGGSQGRLSPVGMRVLGAIIIVTLGWILYSRWLRLLQPYNPVRLALQVEKRHPELQSLLVSYVQLAGQSGAEANMSLALLAALRNEALRATAPMNFKEIVSYRELKKILLFSAVVLLFFGATTLKGSPIYSTLLTRLVNPAAEALYPTNTHLLELKGADAVPYGAQVILSVKAGGVIPAEGRLHVKSKEGNWEKLTCPLRGHDIYEYRFDAVYQDFDFYFDIGDARSVPARVRVVPAPRVVNPRIVLRHPRYTGLPDAPVNSLTVQGAPEGTVLEWQLTTDQPVSEAWLLLTNGEKRKMTVDAAGTHVSAQAPALDSFSYKFQWKLKAYPFEYKEDVQYSVQVKPDQGPQVSVLYPPEDEKGTINKILEVAYKASDEYGLGQTWLVYAVGDAPEKRIPLERLSGKETGKLVKRTLKEDIANLAEKVVVSYYIEVADNRDLEEVSAGNANGVTSKAASQPTTQRVAGPNVTKSATRRMEVVSAQDYFAYVLDKRSRLLTELSPLYGEEKEAEKEIRGLIDDLTVTPASVPASK